MRLRDEQSLSACDELLPTIPAVPNTYRPLGLTKTPVALRTRTTGYLSALSRFPSFTRARCSTYFDAPRRACSFAERGSKQACVGHLSTLVTLGRPPPSHGITTSTVISDELSVKESFNHRIGNRLKKGYIVLTKLPEIVIGITLAGSIIDRAIGHASGQISPKRIGMRAIVGHVQ